MSNFNERACFSREFRRIYCPRFKYCLLASISSTDLNSSVLWSIWKPPVPCVPFPTEHCSSKYNVSRHTFTFTQETTWVGEIRLEREHVYMHCGNTIIPVFTNSWSVSQCLPGCFLSQDCIFKYISDLSFWTQNNCFLFWSEHLYWWFGEASGSIVGEHKVSHFVHLSEFFYNHLIWHSDKLYRQKYTWNKNFTWHLRSQVTAEIQQ